LISQNYFFTLLVDLLVVEELVFVSPLEWDRDVGSKRGVSLAFSNSLGSTRRWENMGSFGYIIRDKSVGTYRV